MRRLMMPREHGAWAMLSLPFITGFMVAVPDGAAWARLGPGAAGALALFMARAPLMRLAKRRYRRGDFGPDAGDNLFSAAVFLAVAAALFGAIALAGGVADLWQAAAVAAALTLLQTAAALALGERSIPSELAGVILLSLTAPLAFLLASGASFWSLTSVTLWAANATYYGASVFIVKMKVASMTARRERLTGSRKLRLAQDSIVYTTVTVSLWLALDLAGRAPSGAPAIFAPLAAYVAWSAATLGSGLKIRTEGFTQLGLSIIFTALLIVVWRQGW